VDLPCPSCSTNRSAYPLTGRTGSTSHHSGTGGRGNGPRTSGAFDPPSPSTTGSTPSNVPPCPSPWSIPPPATTSLLRNHTLVVTRLSFTQLTTSPTACQYVTDFSVTLTSRTLTSTPGRIWHPVKTGRKSGPTRLWRPDHLLTPLLTGPRQVRRHPSAQGRCSAPLKRTRTGPTTCYKCPNEASFVARIDYVKFTATYLMCNVRTWQQNTTGTTRTHCPQQTPLTWHYVETAGYDAQDQGEAGSPPVGR
jgi:hypothetical protein